MIDPKKIDKVTTIVTHAGCADGVASALILKDVLPFAKVVFVAYGQSEREQMKAEPGMVFCDMTPPEARVREFVDAGAIVLDHHKSARKVVEAFGENGVFADETIDTGVCGATLAYREVWCVRTNSNNGALADFALLAGIRDTWQKHSPHWTKACEQAYGLTFYPPQMLLEMTEERSLREVISEVMKVGQILAAKRAGEVERAAKKVLYRQSTYMPNGRTRLTIAFTNGTHLTSDLAEYLEKTTSPDLVVGVDFSGGENTQDLEYNYSLRSHTGFDCSALAKRFGGGGHKAAAGFGVKGIPTVEESPFVVFLDAFNDFVTEES